MLTCLSMTKPNASGALQEQGSLGVISFGLGGKPAENHRSSSFKPINQVNPGPKFGDYSRSDSRKLGNLDEERRR